MSEEKGIEHTKVYKKSVDHTKFTEYLDELSILNKHEPICIFLDNLKVHIMEEVMMKMNELQFEVIRNVPYAPDYNPAESCLSKIKNHHKRQKLNKLVNEEEIDVLSLINESVNVLT